MAGDDALVRWPNDLPGGEIGAQGGEHAGRHGETADMGRTLVEEPTAADRAMDIVVEQVEHFAREIGGVFHGGRLRGKRVTRSYAMGRGMATGRVVA